MQIYLICKHFPQNKETTVYEICQNWHMHFIRIYKHLHYFVSDFFLFSQHTLLGDYGDIWLYRFHTNQTHLYHLCHFCRLYIWRNDYGPGFFNNYPLNKKVLKTSSLHHLYSGVIHPFPSKHLNMAKCVNTEASHQLDTD